MKKLISFLFLIPLFLLLSSCKRQNPVEMDDGSFLSLNGKIENWTSGNKCSAVFLSMTITSETSPDSGTTFAIGKAEIDGQGNFTMANIPPPPDTLYHLTEESGNIGFFYNYPVNFHGYTNPFISVLDSAKNFKSYLIYSTQSTSVLPYINENTVIGDYTMVYQYSDRDITIDSSNTNSGANNVTLHFTYKVSLKKGWNKMYAVTTAVSSTDRSATWTTTTPETPGKWYMCNRYLKTKQNLFQ